jgi:hypothetical protein
VCQGLLGGDWGPNFTGVGAPILDKKRIGVDGANRP